MTKEPRISLNKYQFAYLLDEVNGMCPICAKELLINKSAKQYNSTLAQAAHIYPHSPSKQEKTELLGVPKLSEDNESLDNLILLCPNCHYNFDHPRTKEEYLTLYNLKKILMTRKKAKKHYGKNNIETDIIQVLNEIGNIDIKRIHKKLSYKAIRVDEKMNNGASQATRSIVTRDVREYYLEIEKALRQLEYDRSGVSDLIAKEIALFYSQLHTSGYSQDEIYFMVNDWITAKTQYKYSLVAPFITAFYIQNCEVFSK